MEGIIEKIELLMFYHLISEGSVITDEGSLNVEMKNSINQRYSFIDDKSIEDRTDTDENKILFLNQVMEILSELHNYLHECESESNPVYFNRIELKQKIEEQLSVNIEENHNEIDDELEQITTEVTDMEL